MSHSPRRILFGAHSGMQGGAELCLDTTLRHLDRARFEPVAVFARDGPMAASARALDVEVEVCPLAWWMSVEWSAWHVKNVLLGGPARIGRMVRRIRREQIELVYSNTAVIYEAAIAARLARVPHVWHVHEIVTPAHMRPAMLPLGLIRRLIGRLSDRVIFESDSARAIFRDAIPEHKLRTIYNSVRFPFPLPPGEGRGEGGTADQRRSARARFDIQQDHCAVAWIGRFSERKDPLMLLRAIPQMHQKARCRFLLVGQGPLEREIGRTIDRLGLGDVCRLVPFQDDVRPVLQAADLLVLTSREESFGLALVEAAASEKPAVATRTQGPAEIVVDGRTGLLVAPGDEPALAAAIDRLAADPEWRASMGQAAARRAAELFCPDKNTGKIQDVLDELLGTRRRAQSSSAGAAVW